MLIWLCSWRTAYVSLSRVHNNGDVIDSISKFHWKITKYGFRWILKWNFEIESITPLLLCALERLTYAVRQLHSHMSIIEWGLHPPILTLMDRISTKPYFRDFSTKFRNRIDNIPIIMYPRKAHVCRASTTQPYEHNRLRLHPPVLTLMDRISTKTIFSWFFNEISKSNP